MIRKLKNLLLGDKAYAETAADAEDRKQLALAALLVEMARADFDESQGEHDRIIDLLAGHFNLSGSEAQELLTRARETADSAVCLFDFSRTLHQSLDDGQKQEVVRLLWQVALADENIDKYEDYLVRKVADLLYVSHSDVVRLKHEVVNG
ncbi:MAG: TerB family tellurite resistance protein [Gammaproteobacteria bacterium]|nr:TerB family tellurite resistance protein [Gammaproteobacteria bacterium]MCP4091597.1 TerB family tellurite resistance protein [Gammaproteobacteria bacterium]MCP4276093.1 TerB family tellurite resistance protein [Gammaproteobacteria bacterium]MCP4830837.1 TerB family tellurite resistance protein [Gammaproteobacteria bacterium]MCP4929663.1 TerB family tellurite resistance protein [Gammaproteobacteria bacterium]